MSWIDLDVIPEEKKPFDFEYYDQENEDYDE